MPRPRRAARGSTRTVRLRPQNPFDLIRLIAHSQSDPRKAVAELVQNSLDAAARSITVIRRRRRKEVSISIRDDGQGVFPELGRPEALEKIATHIGHSFKRNLSPAQRRAEMTLGKYGIGLLGFWAVGRELEMRTRVGGSEVWALRLEREEPEGDVLRVPQRLIEFPGETWTEVVILGVHPSAARLLSGRKLGEYLSSELRGQLLERQVRLRMVDRLAQRADLKDFLVKPRRFRGRKILERALALPDHSPVRVELYYVGEVEDRRPAVALTCGGAVVCEDVVALEGQGLEGAWSAGLLEGVVEFADLEVAPATRRGFLPGPAAEALLAALRELEPELAELLGAERERARREEDEGLGRELRKVFGPVARELPHYDFFPVAAPAPAEPPAPPEAAAEGEPLGRRGTEEGAEPPAEPASEVVEEGEPPLGEPELLPPGPLAEVRIAPRRVRLLPGASRLLTARALDAEGRLILEAVEFHWSLREGQGVLSAEGARATFAASEELGTAVAAVEARQGDRAASAEALLEVVEKLAGERQDAGIPDPQRVVDPQGDWRSRMVGRRWEYNAAHPDYQAVRDDPRRRLRYFVHLFAKEIVLRNYGEPKDEKLLERFVEVLTHIRMRGGNPAGAGRKPRDGAP